MDNSNNEVKKSKKGLWICLAILIVAIVAVLAYKFLTPQNPKDVFVGKVQNAMEGTTTQNQEKMNATVALTANIETTDEELKQVAEYVNQGKVTLNVQKDSNTNKMSMAADVDYQGSNLLSGKVFYQKGDKNAYVYVKDLFDKYLKFNMEEALGDEEELAEVLEVSDFGKVLDQNKANKIFADTLKENLKDEYFSKEKANDMDKVTMKLTVAELKTVYVNVMTALKNNQEFLNCYEKTDKVKEILDKALEVVDEIDNEYDNATVEVSIYTKGSSSETKKVEFKVVVSEKEEGTFTLTRVDANNYEFNLTAKMEEDNMPVSVEALNGKVNIQKVDNNTKKITVVVENVPEVGKVTLNIEAKMTNTTDLDSIDVSNSVDVNNMSQQDMMTLYTNLTKMKIYSLFGGLME